MFGRNKFNIPVVIFRDGADGLVATNSSAFMTIIKGNRRLKLKSGLLINADSTSKLGSTYYTYTPDEKVFFPMKINKLGRDAIQRITKYEREHIDELSKIDNDETLEVDKKEQMKKDIIKQALTEEERHLLDKYGVGFDILPDQTAYEVLQQQLEEANKLSAAKKKSRLEVLQPVIMVVGVAIAFAIIAYATASYLSSASSNAHLIASSSQQIVAELKSVLQSLGTSTTHTTANSTIPSP